MTTVTTTAETSATANGLTPIPFTFQALSATEVGVTRAGVVASPSTYTVTLNGDGTGTVTPLTDWGTDAVVVYSDPNYEQLADFQRFTAFYPDQFVPPLDRLARSIIALKRFVVTTFNAYINLSGAISVSSRPALALLAASQGTALLTEVGRKGKFNHYTAAEYLAETGRVLSTDIAADTAQGILVATATGAWLRDYEGGLVPDWFGAKGNGTINDQVAFDGLNSLTAALGYANIALRKNAVYRAGGQTLNTGGLYQQGKAIINANGFSSLIIQGNGATIKHIDGLKFGNFNISTGAPVEPTLPYVVTSTRADIGIAIAATDVAKVQVSDLTLDGNSANQVLGGHWGDTGYQCSHTGMQHYGCQSVERSNLTIKNFLLDGWVHGDTGLTLTDEPCPLVDINVTVDSVGRNCGSLVGCNSATFINMNNSRPGHAPKPGGGFLGSAPQSAFDIEAESAIIRNVNIYGGTLAQGPTGSTCFVADSGDSADINLHGVKLVGAVWARKPRITFNKCTLFGYFAVLFGGQANQNDNTLIDNCAITDATLGDTPLQNVGVGNLVLDGTGAGAGVRVQRTTFDLTRLLLNLVSMKTADVMAIMRHSTTYVANQLNLASLDAGKHIRLRFIEALTAPLPADGYYVAGSGVAEMIDCDLVAGGGKLFWTTWSVGGGGYAGKYDNQDLAHKRLTLQKQQGGFAEFYGTAGLRFNDAKPTTGTYTLGEIVLKENPGVGGVFAWRRLTTGSAHVLGTDWEALTIFAQAAQRADDASSIPSAAPAGGTGTAAGGYDTAGNRDAMIATVNGTRTAVSSLKTEFNDLLAKLRTAGILAP
jgi:hypothetical protein